MAKIGRPRSEPTTTLNLRIITSLKWRLKAKYGKSLNHVVVEKLKQLDLDQE